jgi:hypothetical protein
LPNSYIKNASIAVQGFEETNLPESFFDLAIGNVPFGSYGVSDKKYDKYKFYIHDYFSPKHWIRCAPEVLLPLSPLRARWISRIPKSASTLRSGPSFWGPSASQQCVFCNAGTEVTTDILFLQKRDRIIDIEPDWLHLSTTKDGIPVNRYFADNTEMVLGTMAYDDRLYGNKSETTCMPYEGADLAELLREALENIHAEITEYELEDITEDVGTSIPADPNVRNFSYTIVDGAIYYRENSRMNRVETSVTAEGRIKGMIALRDCVRELIEYQTEDYSDEIIQEQQCKLNRLYDAFVAKYGLLNSRGNNMAFSDDSSYCLLCSLEILDRTASWCERPICSPNVLSATLERYPCGYATEALAISIGRKSLWTWASGRA